MTSFQKKVDKPRKNNNVSNNKKYDRSSSSSQQQKKNSRAKRYRGHVLLSSSLCRSSKELNLPGLLRSNLFTAMCKSGRVTDRLIRRSYVWPNMTRDITNWCKCCLDCQQFRISSKNLENPIQNYMVENVFIRRINWLVVRLNSIKITQRTAPLSCTNFLKKVHVYDFRWLKLQTLDDGFAKASDVSAKSSETLFCIGDRVALDRTHTHSCTSLSTHTIFHGSLVTRVQHLRSLNYPRLDIENLQEVSCTDVRQKWGKVKKHLNLPYQKIIPIYQYCHFNKPNAKIKFKVSDELKKTFFETMTSGQLSLSTRLNTHSSQQPSHGEAMAMLSIATIRILRVGLMIMPRHLILVEKVMFVPFTEITGSVAESMLET
ncbi:unnamed protein product [Trichogramma brassicae]|uniref:Integrase zinc-binding domain-containing protein n=1 Tax=Trichogramma brassicae TaxID=86971 RepID=A0A6H5INF8_9HYME|nr:unnamed protein product [Trichogramma brassicae]